MRLLVRFLLAILANLVALLAAARLVSGVMFSGDLKTLLAAALLFTLLNYLLKPVLKLILGPIIVITLGLGVFIVNAIILKLLDNLSPALSIHGVLPLLEATLIVSVINIVFHFVTRK